MATLQDVIDAACLIIGGTQPDPTHQPWLYSGYTAGDGTGTPGLHNAYSSPPGTIQDAPTALILPGPFTAGGEERSDVLVQGAEFNVDHLRLLVLVSNNDSLSEWPVLVPFRDSIPSVLRAHTQLDPTLNPTLRVLTSWVSAGKPGVFEWGGTQYIGWEFTLTVQRLFSATYSA